MSAPFVVTVEVAGLSWTVTDLDPATPGPTAPLQLRRALPEDQLWPAQPVPDAATFGLVAATAVEVGDVVEGADVHLTFEAPPNPTPVTFDGNVTDVEVTPTAYTDPATGLPVDGVRVTVTAVGYLAQLWEEPVSVDEPVTGVGTFPEDRLFNLFDATPWPTPGYPVFANTFTTPDLRVMKVDGEALGPHLDKLLRVWLWEAFGVPRSRLIVVPNLDPATRELDDTDPWQLVLVSNKAELVPTADLAATPTGFGVVPSGEGESAIPADRVQGDLKFTQRKRSNVSAVTMRYYSNADEKDHSLTVSNGSRPMVRQSVDADLEIVNTSQVNQEVKPVAEFYLPPAGADAWGTDAVSWQLHADTPGRLPPDLGELVTIGPLAESINPNARGWIIGLVRAWTLTVGPPVVVDLELATTNGIAEAGGPAQTWNHIPVVGGPTWDQLRATDTWDDYALLRDTP